MAAITSATSIERLALLAVGAEAHGADRSCGEIEATPSVVRLTLDGRLDVRVPHECGRATSPTSSVDGELASMLVLSRRPFASLAQRRRAVRRRPRRICRVTGSRRRQRRLLPPRAAPDAALHGAGAATTSARSGGVCGRRRSTAWAGCSSSAAPTTAHTTSSSRRAGCDLRRRDCVLSLAYLVAVPGRRRGSPGGAARACSGSLIPIVYVPLTICFVLTNMRYTITVQPLMFAFIAFAILALLDRGARRHPGGN